MAAAGGVVCAAERRQELLAGLLAAVKQCQARYSGQAELATENSQEAVALCAKLEQVLQHGLRRTAEPSLGLAVIKNVKDLVSNNFGSGDSDGGVWRVVWPLLTQHEYERFLSLPGLTDLGRGRAWLRAALNEQSLERWVAGLQGDAARLAGLYEHWAFLRDSDRAALLPSIAAGLTSVRFALKLDPAHLNGDQTADSIISPNLAASISGFFPSSFKPSASPSSAGSSSIARRNEPIIANEKVCDIQIDTSKVRTKKKKKVKTQAQVVSFDYDATVIVAEEVTECVIYPNVHDSEKYEKVDTVDIPAAVEENVKLSFDPIDLQDKREVEFDDGQNFYDIREIVSSKDVEMEKSEDEGETELASLTPVTTPSVGALLPVSRARLLSETEGNCVEDWSCPAPDWTAGSGAGPVMAVRQGEVASLASGHSLASQQSGSSLRKEDLKQALLAMMEKKDELEEQARSLKVLLDQEIGAVADVRQELNDIKHISREKVEKLEARNVVLMRENDLLKHQLKKYVGAVQTLRDGPEAHETLAQLEGEKDSEQKKYIDYHYEASEYEKKLIQVAEMHGELLEFNENLQKTVQNKDNIIQRLKEELISLRGPLPEDNEDDTSLCSSFAESSSIGSVRVLVNIWIPSVFLAGAGSNRHHVYQVFVRIRDSEWNVYRRYSQFHQMHQSLRKKDPIVNSFDFPPKKSLGNKSERFVEDRRQHLQSYLRSIVNYLVTTNVSLSTAPDKETLLALLPFFADTVEPGGEARRPARLGIFSRRSQSSHPQPQPVL